MPLKTISYFLLSLCLLLLMACQGSKPSSTAKTKVRPEKRVLLFTKTAPGSYRHESIAAGIPAVLKLGRENGILVDTTENSDFFTDSQLKGYSALIFLSTNQDVFNAEQEAALQRYIWAGGGFVGIHAATGVERDWKWFGQLIGGHFLWHTPQQKATIDIQEANHPATQGLPKRWQRYDEWYLFRDMNPAIKMLATLDSSTYQSDRHPADYPFAWYHEFEGGRSFYTAGGHNSVDYADPLFLRHILGGITYTIGENHELDYTKAAAKK